MTARRCSSAPPAAFLAFTEISFTGTFTKDLNELQKGIDESDAESSNLDTFSLELFENIAWLMAKHQNPDVPDTPEDWLDQFNTFSIYEILPQIIELWGLNVEQQVESKKNIIRQSGK